MSKPTITTLFGGIGGVDCGAIAAGFEPCESVEFDPQLAELHKANIGGKMHVKNILDCDPFKFERPDVLHASTVCKSYSAANPSKGEKQLDIDCALKVCEFLKVLQPKHFTLENVPAYRHTRKWNPKTKKWEITAFGYIVNTLYSLGYWLDYQVLNSADFGVPQSRRRLILIAVKDGFIPSLPPKERHIGWYEAIKDKVHDLPDSQLAEWQIKDEFIGMLLYDRKDLDHIWQKPVLIENTGARSDRELQTRTAIEPCWTLRAMGEDGHWHRANALLENAKVKALDIWEGDREQRSAPDVSKDFTSCASTSDRHAKQRTSEVSSMTTEPDPHDRILTLTDEMKHDADNPALGATEYRARLRHYRRQTILLVSALIAAKTKIE